MGKLFGIEDDFGVIAWFGTLEEMKTKLDDIAKEYRRWRVTSYPKERRIVCQKGKDIHTYRIMECSDK